MDDVPPSHFDQAIAASEKEVGSGAIAGVARSSVMAVGAFLRSSIPGTLSGIAEDTSGYPFDLVKTKMQVAHGKGNEASAAYVIRETINKHGVKGLFRGLSFPLLSGGLINGILFGTYGSVAEILHERGVSHLSLQQVWAAGTIAGVIQSFVNCPVELIKCKMQVSHGSETVNSLSIARSTNLRGLYRGITSILIKDGPGYGFFFATYEYMKRRQRNNYQIKHDVQELPRLVESSHVLLAGGTAGMVFGVLSHPVDVVKSTMQTDSSYKNTWECIKHIYRNGGLRAFLSGITPVTIRAFPSQAIGFFVYEMSLKLWPDRL